MQRIATKSSSDLLGRFFLSSIIVLLLQFALPNSALANEVTKQVTPAGHSYWHYPVENAKRSAVVITWPTGISMLPKGQEMAARLGINLMLNGGAGGKSPGQIIAEFGDLDAGSRLFVTPEEIRGFIVTPDAEAFKAAEIANLVLKSPNFSQNWFKREKGILIKWGKERNVLVLGIGWTLSREILMGDHPYKNYYSLQPTANTEKIELDTIRSWHSKAFATGDIKIVATGTSEIKGLGKAIDRALDGLPKGNSEKNYSPMDLKVRGKTIIFHAPKATKSMILTFGKLPPASDNKDIYVNTALGVLGYGSQSRLFKAVRTGLRASYGFRSGFIDYTRKQRLFHMSGEIETAKLQAALNTVRDTYEGFRTDGIGFIEFPFARKYYRERIEATLKKPRDAAYLLMEARLNGAPIDDITTLTERIDNLSRSDVNKFILENFAPFDQLLTIIVTPDASAVKGDCTITSYAQWKSCY